eukprot:TRINITY_DN100954_c0_g1_i1.p1 TRINITY_DN100954_c0_g1~~TRINITY_DN100954_c0_g1_i1.p1  ORF type:complete len:447 (+),score=71.42 TRINITY_DN100954_c0_g1_i1:88-1428(+)
MAEAEGLRCRKNGKEEDEQPSSVRTISSLREVDAEGEKESTESFFTIPKLILHAILLFLGYIWWDTFGMWLSPVYAYVAFLLLPVPIGTWNFQVRMQVRSVVIIYLTSFSLPLLLFWVLRRGGRVSITMFCVYVLWYSFFDDAPKRGGRFFQSFRQRNYWRHFASYFPMKLTKTAELDPEGHYLFGYHPHGIISLGALCNFATEATGFATLFPGVDLRLLTLAMNFRIPFFREYLLGMGINDASRESVNRNLSRNPGSSVMIVVGGARESLETQQGGRAGLILEKRKGFVKIAIQSGASLVPVFSFGENDLYGVYSSKKLMQFQLKMQKRMGFAVPLFFGRALTGGILHRLFGLDVGLMPVRVPVHSVVGKPIHTVKTASPTQEQIDEIHLKYMEELKKLHDDWKEDYEKMRSEAFEHCGEERLKIMQSNKFELNSLRSELDFVLE